MKLQIAIDLVDSDTALKMVEQIHDVIDIVEVGTPMIMREGMLPVKKIKAKFPDVIVLADTKIVDGGDIECGDAIEAGADIVTVLALAADETIKAVINTARKHGKESMADMISVEDVAARAIQLEKMGIDYICLHTALDVQNTTKAPLEDLVKVKEVIKVTKTAVAGGINMQTIYPTKEISPDIVVAGGSLTKATDLRKSVIEMKNVLLDRTSN